MQAEAHIAAAIEILDDIVRGEAAERRLTNWARAHRFAGSSDRAAIRDLVFDALRRKRSYAWMGGADTGRGLMLGALRAAGRASAAVFTGKGFAPSPLSAAERGIATNMDDAPEDVRLDCPAWLWPVFREAFGARAAPILSALRDRAPVFLRVNLAKTRRDDACVVLAEEGIDTVPHHLAGTALEVTGNERRVRNSRAFRDGLVEFQDAASQALVERCMPFVGGGSVLDYCAGGGGKALAFAASGAGGVTAHDVAPERMKDIPVRAARAGTPVRVVPRAEGRFDFVLCDAPCSGSGAWRRQPQGKWTLDETRLSQLTHVQDEVLDRAQHLVGPGGALGYATCSLLPIENDNRVEAFRARNPGWSCVSQAQWTPLDGADGFFLAVLQKN